MAKVLRITATNKRIGKKRWRTFESLGGLDTNTDTERIKYNIGSLVGRGWFNDLINGETITIKLDTEWGNGKTV